ncbi:MAG: UDP-N-acetylmuramoyl-tripeptide--D-alanyl-D-alanine ligase [Ignavibacteriae bacterium]|nr:UDP-N-acetylmuramoyl-tripeptide--D-alanyl-D-alanine ligase [Ignavibacteriota bacterium]
MKLTLIDIFNLNSAVIYNPDLYRTVNSVSTDTRTIKKNSLFVAIKGKNFDGHNYIQEAIKKGASAILVNKNKLSSLDFVDLPIISVSNTIKAYGELANIIRNKFSGKVISITGSNGKTTTKEMIAHLLSAKYKVHKTVSNNNNNIGVPLTILTAPNNSEIMVLEHGTNHFGEIEFTAKIAQPDYGLITNIGSSHLQYLISAEKVYEEKTKLFDYVKSNGNVFINADDKFLKNQIKVRKNSITYGSRKNLDLSYEIVSISNDSKYKININGLNKNFNIVIPLLGKANIQNIITAIAVALKLGLSKAEIINSIKTLKPVKGRLCEFDFNQFTIIDDTYNANPESVKNALDVLRTFGKRKNKILLLGDMFELGDETENIHSELAANIKKTKINLLLSIGKNTKVLNNSKKLGAIKGIHFNNRNKLHSYLESLDLKDSVILVKGSRGMKMEEFVETIKRKNA